MKQGRQDTPPQLERRAQPGRIRALVLAVLVHAAFFALIVFGVTWQVRPTAPVQAELVASLPPVQKSEPTPEPPKPEPPEPPKPEPPRPEPPKPEAPKPEPPKPEPPKPDPEIALKAEREKKEREKKERLEQEKREKLEKARQEEARKKREQEEAKKKREQEEAAKKKREDERRRREEEIARKEAEKAAQAAADARQAEFNKYVDAIKAKVRGRANVPDTVTGNPELVVRVRILPGGEVLDITIVKRSGNPAYDAAIERAIRSASPLPVPPANSELFHQFREPNLIFRHER